MGFFSDLKEDLTQAVNELLPEEELKKQAVPEAQEDDPMKELEIDMADLDALLERVDTIEVPADMDISRWDTDDQEDSSREADSSPEDTKESDFQDGDGKEEIDELEELEELEENDLEASIREAFGEKKQGYGVGGKMDSQMKSALDETAIITAGMSVTGDITSEGSVDVIGTINGNVDILGKLNITGTINGNSKAAEIYADSAKITGEIVSEGSVKIGQSSVIIGNISAKSAVVAGAVKGDIDVQGPVILDASAIVMGNIKSKSVQINNGAVIEGMCSQVYAEVNPTSFFDDYKTAKK